MSDPAQLPGSSVAPADAGPPADPAVYGEGLAALLDALAARMPRAEVETAWAFPLVRREGREHGVAVLTRAGEGGRHLVYRARYVRVEKGQERGRIDVTIEETAEAPAELLPLVIEGVRRRADEAGDAELVDLGPWKRSDADGDAS